MSDDKAPHDLEIRKNTLGASSAADLDEHRRASTLAPSSSPLKGKKKRPFLFLIIPFVLVLGIIAVLIAMIVWLLTSQKHPFGAPASVTREALIVDESSRWCKIQKEVLKSATCGSDLEPSLLGLTLSGLLVRTPLIFDARV